MNQKSVFLNRLLSVLKFNCFRPVRPMIGFIAASVVLTAVTIYFQGSDLVRDQEQRFQSNFQLFGTFFKTPETALSPIVVLLINDPSLPEGSSRSPVDRKWLRSFIEQVTDQKPALIGLNILLDRPLKPADDRALALAMAQSGNIIIRSDPFYPPLPPFADAALDQGTIRFRFDSSGAVQEICQSPSACQSPNIFHLSLIRHFAESDSKSAAAVLENTSDWLRINFYDGYRVSAGRRLVRFPVFFAHELKKMPPGALQDKIVLIGAGFPDLYPLFRTPLSQDGHFLQETEILAHVIDMIISERYLTPLQTVYAALLLLAVFSVLSLLLTTRGILPGLWFTLAALPGLFFLSAIAFTAFRIEIPFVLPALMLILFLGIGMVQQNLQERFARLVTELKLKEAKIDFLTNELHTHHLFNELSRLNVMIGQHPDTARAYLVEFAELLRVSLKYGDQPRVPIAVQIDYLKTYAQQQGIIHGGGLRLTFDVQGSWDSVHAPWHVFFPLVENAVKHGEFILRQRPSQAVLIEIGLREERRRLCFTVQNPFLPDSSGWSTGKGLSNLGDRLKWSYPRGGFELTSVQAGANWIATLRLPMD
ncbi:CHASE2 domain-containing protein [bacterium]|nr:CHASE2 domain-containing protein [bacterium]